MAALNGGDNILQTEKSVWLRCTFVCVFFAHLTTKALSGLKTRGKGMAS